MTLADQVSAAEKLRRLAVPWLTEDTYPEDGSVGHVMDALPQLIAVVEAATHAEDALRSYGSGVELIGSRHSLLEALAALSEALA